MTTRLGFVHTGPRHHGVTRFGRVVHAAAAETVQTVGLTAGRLLEAGRSDSSPVIPIAEMWIVQFTDHLFAPDPEGSVLVFQQVCDMLRPSSVAVVLHDLPTCGAHEERRRRAYSAVAGTADVVVLCSRHEAERLRACGFAGPVTVIPHFVEDRATRPRPSRAARPAVGVLGFVYPGKGHPEVLRACALLDAPVSFVAMGEASPGHEVLVDEIVELAAELDIGCTVTGWLEDAALDRMIAAVDVPVAAHQEPSASGSVATWLAAGRRPIVRSSPYAMELLELAPGAVTTYDGDDRRSLLHHLRHAVDDPDSTYHDGLPDVLSLTSCAGAYVRLLRG